MEDPEADWNRDGRITVKEAFLHSYRKMVKKGEEITPAVCLQCSPPEEYKRTATGMDVFSPQLDVLGEAHADDFSVETPPAPNSASRPAP